MSYARVSSRVFGPLSQLEQEWELESWVRRYPDHIVDAIQEVQAKMQEDGIPTMPDVTAYQWVKIMNARDLETAMRWAGHKHAEGLTVRIRNIKTGDIIMGIICRG